MWEVGWDAIRWDVIMGHEVVCHVGQIYRLGKDSNLAWNDVGCHVGHGVCRLRKYSNLLPVILCQEKKIKSN